MDVPNISTSDIFSNPFLLGNITNCNVVHYVKKLFTLRCQLPALQFYITITPSYCPTDLTASSYIGGCEPKRSSMDMV